MAIQQAFLRLTVFKNSPNQEKPNLVSVTRLSNLVRDCELGLLYQHYGLAGLRALVGK